MAEKKIVADKPTHLIAPNDKVSNTLFRSAETDELKKTELFKRFFNGGMEIKTVNRKDAFANVRLKSDLAKPFTLFDGLVYAAICSLVCNPLIKNSGYFTTKMVYDAMRQGTGVMSDEMKEAIEASIDRMARTQVTIDYEKELQYFAGLKPQENDEDNAAKSAALKRIAKMNGFSIFDDPHVEIVKTEIKKFALTENMLYIKYLDVDMKINGRKVDKCYQILEQPVLYRYALMKRQVIMIPFKQTKTKENISREFLITKDILTRRIYAMKGNSKIVKKTIRLDKLYKEIFAELGLKDLSLESRSWYEEKIRAKSKNILKQFAKNGFIKDFKVNKVKKRIVSYEIILEEQKEND